MSVQTPGITGRTAQRTRGKRERPYRVTPLTITMR